MSNKIDLNKYLASKLYLFSVGLYAAIACVFGTLYLFHVILGLNPLTSIFLGYFITVLCRSFYDQLIIYELKITQINFKKNSTLAFISACVLTTLYHFIRTPLGEWAIPVTIIISMKLITQIKRLLWPNSTSRSSDFLKIYSQKLQTYILGLYSFFLATALITYQLIKLYGISYFYFAFAFAIFLGLMFEQIYDLVAVYQIKPTALVILIISVFTAIFSICCSGLVFMFMQVIGLSGKAATIIGIIILKLIQPLLLNMFLISYQKHQIYHK